MPCTTRTAKRGTNPAKPSTTTARPRQARKQAPLFVETPTGPIAALVRNCTCPHPLCGECALGGCSRQCDVCQPNPNASPALAPAPEPTPTPAPEPAPVVAAPVAPARRSAAPIEVPKPAPAEARGEAKGEGEAKPKNLSTAEARLAVLAALKAGPADRNALKRIAPHGDYTSLMKGLQGEGLCIGAKVSGRWGYSLSEKGLAALACGAK